MAFGQVTFKYSIMLFRFHIHFDCSILLTEQCHKGFKINARGKASAFRNYVPNSEFKIQLKVKFGIQKMNMKTDNDWTFWNGYGNWSLIHELNEKAFFYMYEIT